MIVAQEQAFLKGQQQFEALKAFVEQAADKVQRIDQVERGAEKGTRLALSKTSLLA